MVRRAKTFYEFAEFRLFPDDRLLLSNGRPVKVPVKAFDILVLLVENAGDLVTKDDLMMAVWPDSFVEEANIQVQVSVLRKALNVGGKQVFETVPRKGYRFTAPVTRHELEPESSANSLASAQTGGETIGGESKSGGEPNRGHNSRIRLVVVAASVVILLTVIGSSWVISSRDIRGSAKTSGDLRLSKLTDTGKAHDPALSTDGTLIAYVNDEDTASTVFLKNRKTGAERQLSTLPGVVFENLVFSPDDLAIYYTYRPSGQYESDLFRQSINGGPSVYVSGNVVSKVTFAPGGRSFAFLRARPANTGYQLITADVDGSNEQLIFDPPQNIFAPAWSPDGSKIAFFSFDDESDEMGNRFRLRELDVNERYQNPITQKFWGYLGEICWLKNSKGLLVIAGDTPAPVAQIWHIDASTGAADKVTNDLNDYAGLEVDASTGQIVTSYAEGFCGIWITGKNHNFTEAREITFGAGQQDGNLGVAWAKNGRIVYSGRKGGYWTLSIMNPDGSGRAPLTSEVAQDGGPVVSADGRTIYFTSDRGDALQSVWKVNSDGGGLEKVPGIGDDHSHRRQESWAELTPDGKDLLYRRSDEKRHRELLSVPVSGGEPTRLSDLTIVSNHVVSPDGSMIAFIFADRDSDPVKTAMAFVPITGGDPVKVYSVPAATPWHTPIRWRPDGSAVTYVACDGSGCNLWDLPVNGGAPYQLTKFDKYDIPAFSWSPDGERLAIARSYQRNDLVLISGFQP